MKDRKCKSTNCVYKLKSCPDVLNAPKLLNEIRHEHEQLGYDCSDLFLGAYRYELEDGFVTVCWQDGWITEEAYEYID